MLTSVQSCQSFPCTRSNTFFPSGRPLFARLYLIHLFSLLLLPPDHTPDPHTSCCETRSPEDHNRTGTRPAVPHVSFHQCNCSVGLYIQGRIAYKRDSPELPLSTADNGPELSFSPFCTTGLPCLAPVDRFSFSLRKHGPSIQLLWARMSQYPF